LEHEHPSLRPYSRGTYGSLLGAESPERRVLEKQILELRQKLTGVEAALAKSGETARAKDQQLKEKDRVIQEITRSEDLKHFIDHVHPDARPLLIAGGELLENFIRSSHCQAWVLSLDIRRSTELMLKARSPSDFATFIASLAESIKAIILRNFGVFDKFTGDGVLAFFPDFYSGEDAGYLAVRTASECHELFNSLYRAHRSLFSIIPLETGLGIGIDRGEVSLVKIGVNLTVVGTPVVYACRLSSTKAGTTALNHGAYESLLNRYGAQLSFDETALDIKHEGSVLNTRARFALGEFCQ
jgi:class 3 adenylate cyclase